MSDTSQASPAKRVLLVEAHAALARLLRETLTAIPEVTVAEEVACAQAAIAAAALGRPDLVVVDLHLPDACGLEVASGLRDAGCEAKIILLIEEDDARYHQAAWLRGAAACVGKERVAAELTTVVRQVLTA